MTKSLQKRLARYKDKDDLREYLLRKTRRLAKLSESSIRTIEESSDDGMVSLILISQLSHLMEILKPKGSTTTHDMSITDLKYRVQ